MTSLVEIDGSKYEGGGAILRIACALSAITKKPCHIFNIRANRPNPGLAPQHLLGIQALAQLCNGKLEGDYLNSKEIKFYPENFYKDRVLIKIPTAGSITLILQTLIPVCFFGNKPVEIEIEGGATDTFFSPTIDYFQYVFLKFLEKIKGDLEINILKRGYYPEGGANVKVKIYPSILEPLNLIERGNFKKILIVSGASNYLKDKKIAERQAAGAKEIFGKLKLPVEEKIKYYDTSCPGSQINLIAKFENTIIGTDNLKKLGEKAEDVGKEAALVLLKEQKSNACLDKHLADQVLLYLALAKGSSKITISEITSHCKTNIWIIKKFLRGNFEIKENLLVWLPKN